MARTREGVIYLVEPVHHAGFDTDEPWALIFDRDGTLNSLVGSRPPWRAEEVSLENGAVDLLAWARLANLRVAVATNQPDAARGSVARIDLELTHRHIMSLLGIEEYFVCWHDDNDSCQCKKPKPAGLLDLAERLSVSPSRCVMIGDRWTDIQAAQSAGMNSVLLRRSYSWDATSSGLEPSQNLCADAEVVTLLQVTRLSVFNKDRAEH